MKCAIDECTNESWQGKFYGQLCAPCFNYLEDKVNSKGFSAAYRMQRAEAINILKANEFYMVSEKYKAL